MGYQSVLRAFSLPVATAFASTDRYKFVKIDANGNAVVCDTVGEGSIGVVQNLPVNNEGASIAFMGITQVVLGATLARNAAVQTDAAGRAVALAAGTRLGIILEGGAVNEIGTVLLR